VLNYFWFCSVPFRSVPGFIPCPLGVILKNENKTDKMVDILDILHKYVPSERSTQNYLVVPNEVFSM